MPSKLGIDEVFTPGGVPSVTYVGRAHLKLEEQVENALKRKYSFIAISGPTKCGKSVLCARVLGDQGTITVQGGQIASDEQFWEHVAYYLNLPSTATKTRMNTWSWAGLLEFVLGIPAAFQQKVSHSVNVGGQHTVSATYNNILVLDAIRELQRRSLSLIIEDFHYIDKQTQRAIIRALKSAVFAGLKVIILAVPHRAFDPTDVESEVEGRVHHIEIPSWSLEDLLGIAEKGFEALELNVPRNVQRRICEDRFGNPLLVQEICYELSYARLALQRGTLPVQSSDLALVYDRLAEGKGLSRFQLLAQTPVGDAAPQMIRVQEGGEENLHMALLSAISRLGPKPVTGYVEIRDSLAALMIDGPPAQEQVVTALVAMTNMVAEGGTAPFEWLQGRQAVAISDPFLLFYLRWVLRDRRALLLPVSAVETAVRVQPTLEHSAKRDDV